MSLYVYLSVYLSIYLLSVCLYLPESIFVYLYLSI